jgi:antitoxin MazE
MRTAIVRIGNSQGLRIPKAILQACEIRDEVELSVEQGRLIVEPSRKPRDGWAAAAREMAAAGEDELLDPATATEFDADEWEW